MTFLFRIKMFLRYAVRAKTKYYLHSPFVYQFYLNVIENTDNAALENLTLLRRRLRRDASVVKSDDLGTGSRSTKTIAEIESRVAISARYGKLLYNLVYHFKPAVVLELGTSIGISSSYMALGNAATRVVTIEGAPEIAEVAGRNHRQLQLTNVEVVTGDFSHTLPPVLQNCPTLDFVFFDGNHTSAATLSYFEQCLARAHENSIFVFDDIYWNQEMSLAWEQIKLHPQVTLTLDVYRFGICFFRKDKLAKEDFVLWY